MEKGLNLFWTEFACVAGKTLKKRFLTYLSKHFGKEKTGGIIFMKWVGFSGEGSKVAEDFVIRKQVLTVSRCEKRVQGKSDFLENPVFEFFLQFFEKHLGFLLEIIFISVCSSKIDVVFFGLVLPFTCEKNVLGSGCLFFSTKSVCLMFSSVYLFLMFLCCQPRLFEKSNRSSNFC